jgi:hypothetical protein
VSPRTVDEYLASLPDDRREVLATVRDVVVANLPPGYAESMTWGMPTYEVPLERYPDTYNGKPLAYVSLAAQKKHYAVYLMGVYSDGPLDRDFRARWAPPSGKRLDMGKSCVRFTKLADADLPLIGETVAALPVEEFLAVYERERGRAR